MGEQDFVFRPRRLFSLIFGFLSDPEDRGLQARPRSTDNCQTDVQSAVSTMSAPLIAELSAKLARTRNQDGGWGYYPGKASRLEATCWAVLALHDAKNATLATSALREWPSREGLLLERRDGEPNYGFHGIALLTLLACGVEHRAGNATLAASLQKVQGLTAKNYEILRQDNTLIAWSWVPNTMSWIEPTSWCLLSLKQWARITGGELDGGRIDQAERFIFDRVCSVGGWNHGNPNVLGTDLRPYVPTTAIALMAMQDKRDAPKIQRSVSYLEAHALAERTASPLALTSCAFGTYDRPLGHLRAAIVDQLPVTEAIGNQATLASALYALRGDHGYGAFKL